MSADINNTEYREKALSEMIQKLHDGATVEDVKGEFERVFGTVSATEIAAVEQRLISGGLPVTEVQRLCDVHAAVFKGSIEEIHAGDSPELIFGHPVWIFKKENRALERLMSNELAKDLAALEDDPTGPTDLLDGDLERLASIDIHYKKKEELIFPFLERYGIDAPGKVMWGVDDDIRADIKAVRELLSKFKPEDIETLRKDIDEVCHSVNEMIFKEENILLPMLLEHFTASEWQAISEGQSEYGFTLIRKPPMVWTPSAAELKIEEDKKNETNSGSDDDLMDFEGAVGEGVVKLPTGYLNITELTALLNTLPVDITFTDANNNVKFFSESSERIFPRTRAIIGRNVENCHPPKSVDKVEQVVDNLRSGRKDVEEFWIQLHGKFIYIRYYALRDEKGEFLGTLEVTQNIQPLREIEGEQRLINFGE